MEKASHPISYRLKKGATFDMSLIRVPEIMQWKAVSLI
jgi:hypothetical protein